MPIFGGNIRMHAPLSITGIRKVKLRTGQVERQKNRIQSTRCSQQSDLRMRSALYSQQTVSMASAVLPFTWLTSSVFTGQVLSGVVDTAVCLTNWEEMRLSEVLRLDEKSNSLLLWDSDCLWKMPRVWNDLLCFIGDGKAAAGWHLCLYINNPS